MKNRIRTGFLSLLWGDLSEKVDHQFLNAVAITSALKQVFLALDWPFHFLFHFYALFHKEDTFFIYIILAEEKRTLNLDCVWVSLFSYGKEDNVHFTCQTNNIESSCTNCFIDLPSSFQLEPSAAAAAAVKSLQSCPTLCDPIDSSPPGSPVHGIFQARVLEWGAIAFSTWAF